MTFAMFLLVWCEFAHYERVVRENLHVRNFVPDEVDVGRVRAGEGSAWKRNVICSFHECQCLIAVLEEDIEFGMGVRA